uniref:mRNA cap guanine-N(7) methyltransferase n=1 Tax=Saccoglossus kowalevskii TaxID=10224 RepID=A0ABM0GM79_SACKO|nr:PREDICTED: mRNA cap guanine-N7 methyltransferase-like [Saccoglossus kowalevskii]
MADDSKGRRRRSRSYSSSEDERPSRNLGDKVARHYNQLPESGIEARSQSRIFYLRNFNNWIKSVCIADTVQRVRDRKGDDCKISVLDVGCGKGGDILKWRIAHIDKLVCADIAATSVQQCEQRYEDNLERARRARQRMFRCQFIIADCSKKLLSERYKSRDQMFHIASCQFALHYSFESYQQADNMIKNLCERIKPGGYFIGTTPDSYEIVMAQKYKMKLVYKKTFCEFFKNMVKDKENEELVSRMQALEQYPPDREIDLVSHDTKDYKHAKKFLEKKGGRDSDSYSDSSYDTSDDERRPRKIGTLTKTEWEAASMYIIFAFQKEKDEKEKEKDKDREKGKRKREGKGERQRERKRQGKRKRKRTREST